VANHVKAFTFELSGQFVGRLCITRRQITRIPFWPNCLAASKPSPVARPAPVMSAIVVAGVAQPWYGIDRKQGKSHKDPNSCDLCVVYPDSYCTNPYYCPMSYRCLITYGSLYNNSQHEVVAKSTTPTFPNFPARRSVCISTIGTDTFRVSSARQSRPKISSEKRKIAAPTNSYLHPSSNQSTTTRIGLDDCINSAQRLSQTPYIIHNHRHFSACRAFILIFVLDDEISPVLVQATTKSS
jgi:hypothetical protein